MLSLHVSVSLVSPMPQQMLLSLATPYHLKILLQLLVILPPQEKLRLLKILNLFHLNKLPQELFDEAAGPLLAGEEI